jgi:hypothetical protein
VTLHHSGDVTVHLLLQSSLIVVVLPSAGASKDSCEIVRTGSTSSVLSQDAKRKGINKVNKANLFITIEI